MAYRQLISLFTKQPVLFTSKLIRNQLIFHASQSTSKSKFSLISKPIKTSLTIVLGLGVTGGAYAYFSTKSNNKTGLVSMIEISDPYVLAEAPDIKPSRQVAGPASNFHLKLLLYQYQTCPFCCKVRAFLDYYGIPYDVVEVNPVMRQQLKFSNYKKVPILVVYDEKTGEKHQLVDSSVIVSILGTYLLNDQKKLQDVLKNYAPVTYTNDEGKEVREVMNQYFLMFGEKATSATDDALTAERKWRKWADQEFVHVLSPNIYRTQKEALQAFNYFSTVGDWENNFSKLERMSVIYIGAAAMYLIGKKLKKKYTLKEDVRDSLYDYCNHWLKAVGKSKYMGGEKPNLADLTVYGFLSSIEGCTAFQDLLANTNIETWYNDVKYAVHEHHGFKTIEFQR